MFSLRFFSECNVFPNYLPQGSLWLMALTCFFYEVFLDLLCLHAIILLYRSFCSSVFFPSFPARSSASVGCGWSGHLRLRRLRSVVDPATFVFAGTRRTGVNKPAAREVGPGALRQHNHLQRRTSATVEASMSCLGAVEDKLFEIRPETDSLIVHFLKELLIACHS